MPNQLTTPFKPSQPLPNLQAAVRSYISEHFTDSHPDEFKADIKQWDALRNGVIAREGPKGLDVHVETLHELITYHAQLSFISTKFPLDIGLSFPYAQPFPPQTTFSLSAALSDFYALPNVQYERVATLFNIGAMYSQLAGAESREATEGIKRAVAWFQNAAALFAHASASLPLLRLAEAPTPDLSAGFLGMLEQLMLAQAQECFWQKAVLDKLKNGTIAKISAAVSEFYEKALEAAKGARPPPSDSVPSSWITHLTVKNHHFAAAAQYRKSLDDLGSNRYGDELGRLKVAQDLVKKALDASKRGGVADAVISDLKSLQGILATNVTRATRDNDLIYLQPIPAASSLPSIPAAAMVKPVLPPEVEKPIQHLHTGPGGLGQPLFQTLVPFAVHLAISLWDERKEQRVRELEGKKADLDGVQASTLHSLNLPGSLQALERPAGLPPTLLKKAEEVRQEGGLNAIRQLMQDVRRVARSDSDVLEETLDLLDQEATEDEQLRTTYPTANFSHPPSHEANAHLTSQTQRYRETLAAASSSDELVRQKLDEWERYIGLLGTDDPSTLESFVPSSVTTLSAPGRPSSPSQTEQIRVTRELRAALEELDDVVASRGRAVDEARRLSKRDDVRPAVMREAGELGQRGAVGEVRIEAAQFEPLFERELGKYGRYEAELEESGRKQGELLENIRTLNKQFLAARKSDSTIKRREQALQTLDLAYHKYRELRLNVLEGLQFYNDFAGIAGQLRTAAQGWVHARRMEKQGAVGHLADSLNNVSHSPSPVPSAPPQQPYEQQQHLPYAPPPAPASAPLSQYASVPQAQDDSRWGAWDESKPIRFG